MNTENNKLIAEFLGDTIEVRPYNDASPDRNAFFYKHKGNLIFLCMDNGTDNAFHEVWMRESAKLTFNKSFDSLMEAIEKMKTCGVTIEIEINPFAPSICVVNKGSYYKQTYDMNVLSAVYNAVVEFIKWYNTQPK